MFSTPQVFEQILFLFYTDAGEEYKAYAAFTLQPPATQGGGRMKGAWFARAQRGDEAFVFFYKKKLFMEKVYHCPICLFNMVFFGKNAACRKGLP